MSDLFDVDRRGDKRTTLDSPFGSATMQDTVIELRRTKRPRFRFLTFLLVILLVLAGIIATVVKLEQDRVRSAAFRQLQEMGFAISVHGDAAGTAIRLVANRPPASSDDLNNLPSLVSDCIRAHDLGFSPELNLELLDLRGTKANDEIVAELKKRFPSSTIRH